MNTYECSSCKRTFKSQAGLNIHMVRMHTERGITWGDAHASKPRRVAASKKTDVNYCPNCGTCLVSFK